VLAQNGDTWIGAVNNGLDRRFRRDAGHFEFSDQARTSSRGASRSTPRPPVDAYFTLGGSLRMTRYGGPRFDERD
jgi:hypothetical protein